MKNILLSIFGILILLLTGCEYFENSDTINSSTIEINISGLPAIADTMTYVAWIENEDTSQTQPLIVFSEDAVNGNIYYKSEKPLRVHQIAQIFGLTIEHKSELDNPNLKPNVNRRILGGRFAGGGCNLGVGENIFNFDNTSAVFNLLTPTDGPNTNETSGLWFVKIENENDFSEGLDLPELYKGWIYEGWIEVNGIFISTGRFSSPSGLDLQNIYAGDGSPLPFPGEDFLSDTMSTPIGIEFPVNLSGANVYISLEINDNKPSGIIPGNIIYQATIPDPAESRFEYNMLNSNLPLPIGNAVINIDLIQ